MIYLAVPYSHPDPEVRERRFKMANKVAGELIKLGLLVYSPISHSHPIANAMGLGLGWETWKEMDCKFMDMCDTMIIIKMEGWDKSRGIRAERLYMEKQGKLITYYDEKELNKG